MWSLINFGKYRGKSLPQVLFTDPEWFFWAIAERVFTGRNAYLAAEAEDLLYKTRNIKIPKPDPENWSVEYYFADNDRLLDVQIVKATECPYNSFLGTIPRDRLSMQVVRAFHAYDKSSGKVLVKLLKEYYFGNGNKRITKKWAEQFFNDSDNFVWPEQPCSYLMRAARAAPVLALLSPLSTTTRVPRLTRL
jgi:hypothetical protein